jgi:predicted ATPase
MAARIRPYLISASFRSDVGIDFEAYPFNIPAVRDLPNIDFHPSVTFFVGENGSGKSTVLEAIAVALGFGPEGGTKNVQLKTAESVSPLHDVLRIARGVPKPTDGYFLRAESFFNVATYMDEVGYLEGYGNRSLHARSHGEAFMALLVDKLRGNGIYLLDEPEAALSPSRQLAALRAIHQLVEESSQFIIATHSPILLAYPNAKIVQFDGSGISETAYEDTEHYVVTRDFLANHERRLGQLLGDEDDGNSSS